MWTACDRAGQYWNPYGYSNNPVIFVDEDGNWFGIDDLIAAGVGFVGGYLYAGISTGNWGANALKTGLIGAAGAWLTYNTAGIAGTQLSALSSSVSAVSSATSVSSAAAAIGNVALNLSATVGTNAFVGAIGATTINGMTNQSQGRGSFGYNITGGFGVDYAANFIGLASTQYGWLTSWTGLTQSADIEIRNGKMVYYGGVMGTLMEAMGNDKDGYPVLGSGGQTTMVNTKRYKTLTPELRNEAWNHEYYHHYKSHQSGWAWSYLPWFGNRNSIEDETYSDWGSSSNPYYVDQTNDKYKPLNTRWLFPWNW